MNELNQKGKSIGVMDTLIASIALVYNLPLVTRNRSHFDRTGLRFEWEYRLEQRLKKKLRRYI